MNPSDDRTPDVSTDDIEEAEVARLVRRYLDPEESVSDDELRDALGKLVQGLVVSVSAGDGGVTVTVEQVSDEGDEPVRDTYSVEPVTDFDGDPALEWSYLGPVG